MASVKASPLTPSKLAHVVFRTNKLQAMRDFYLEFLGASIAFEAPNVLAFLRYDDEHHRIGIIGMPDIGDKVKASSGLEHIAFTYDTLPNLLQSYKIRKSKGMDPFWCINHGPTISIYYHDPDGNIIETEYDTLGVQEADDFVASEAYRTNPIGADFDPEEMIQRLESGEELSKLVKRDDIGPRGIDSVPE